MFSIRAKLLICLVLMASSIYSVEAGRRRRLKFCKMDYFFECYSEAIWYFTAQFDGTGIPFNQTEMEQFCFQKHDFIPYCAKQWMKRCGSPHYFDLMQKIYTDPLQQSMEKFCDSNGLIRPKFLKHAPCLVKLVKLSSEYRDTCIWNMLASTEYIHERAKAKGSMGYLIHNQCCTYNQWEECIGNMLREKCSQEATEVFPTLLHYSSLKLLRGLCVASNPHNVTQCNPADFRAPSNFVPRGFNSGSFFSYFFSYLCPNVGFGIDESRDKRI